MSDLRIGKRVRAMWEAFHGRASAYEAAMQAANLPALETALARNVWRGAAPDGAAIALGRLMLAQATCLADQPLAALTAGEVRFLAGRRGRTMTPELHRPVAVERVGPNGLDVTVEAGAEECARLARRLNLPAWFR